MNVAIVTFHKALSCGAMLQAWALKTVLERMGHHVEFPDCNTIGLLNRRWPYKRPPQPSVVKNLRARWKDFLDNAGSVGVYRPAVERYREFRLKNLPEKKVLPPDFAAHYECVVYGSDQVWNLALTKEESSVFLGEDVPIGVRKISYAASLGDGVPTSDNLNRLKIAVSAFDAVSVREPKVAKLLGDAFSLVPPTVLDPTLLLDSCDYLPLARPAHPSRNYLYCYSLYHHDVVFEKAKQASRKLGLRLVYTPLYQYTRKGMPSGVTYSVSPDMFVDFMANASCVLTDSFHGTAFALLNHKPFVTYRLREDSSQSRPGALLESIGENGRLVPLSTSVEAMLPMFGKSIPASAYSALQSLRLNSLSWLERALAGGRKE